MMRMNSTTHRVAAGVAAGLVTFYVSEAMISPHPAHASQPLYSDNDAHAPEREPAQSQTQRTITIKSSASASIPGSSVAFSPHWAWRVWAAD
jgi:hypothetical protein